jgi:hypothetical protein
MNARFGSEVELIQSNEIAFLLRISQ